MDLQVARLARSGLALVVAKSQRALYVYRDGVSERRYPIVLGQQPDGAKRYEGDMRTPEGIYHIAGKRAHRRWSYFLAIDYPNMDDLQRYHRELAAGLVPTIEGEAVNIGNDIGIHGNDRQDAQHAGKDWTLGCVAMDNDDVRDIYRIVVVGTPVLFLP